MNANSLPKKKSGQALRNRTFHDKPGYYTTQYTTRFSYQCCRYWDSNRFRWIWVIELCLTKWFQLWLRTRDTWQASPVQSRQIGGFGEEPRNRYSVCNSQVILGHESVNLVRQVKCVSQDLTRLVAELGGEPRSPHPVCTLSHTPH